MFCKHSDFRTYGGFGDEMPVWKEKRLATQDEIRRIDKKLNLILDHLGLEFVHERTVEEPAKLQKKSELPVNSETTWPFPLYLDLSGKPLSNPTKKRGRPRKK